MKQESLASGPVAPPVLLSQADRSSMRGKAEWRSPSNRGKPSTRILVAVDGSRDSLRAVKYVGRLLSSVRAVDVTLFHVLNPLPPILREHGGSEDPVREEQLGQQLRNARKDWYRKEQRVESPILAKARRTLEGTGFRASRIHVQFGYEARVAETILQEARRGHYDTIVVGRRGVSGLQRMFFGGITRKLLQQATGFAVWVVE